jgi:hypothetical protein
MPTNNCNLKRLDGSLCLDSFHAGSELAMAGAAIKRTSEPERAISGRNAGCGL